MYLFIYKKRRKEHSTNDTVAKSLVNGLADTGFAYLHQFQLKQVGF